MPARDGDGLGLRWVGSADEAYVVVSGQTGKEVSKPVSKKIAEEMVTALSKSTSGVFTTRKTARPLASDNLPAPVRVGGRDGFAPGVGPNANPVLKAYESYRDMDTARLKEIYKRSHKVSDLNGVPKRDLIADLLEGEFGRKRVDAAFAGKSKDSLSPVKVVAA
jgi:hypothetical protein